MIVQLSRTLLPVLTAVGALCICTSLATDQSTAQTKSQECPSDSGLKLPAGFCATIFADKIGHARHLVVAPNGVVYVNTWSGDYYPPGDKPPAGGFLVALQDKTGAGKADVIERFGETVATGGAGGTGIGLYKGSIYAEINDRIVRYALPAGSIVPQGSAHLPSFPDCPWAAITPCIHSPSPRTDPCTSMWARRPTPAS